MKSSLLVIPIIAFLWLFSTSAYAQDCNHVNQWINSLSNSDASASECAVVEASWDRIIPQVKVACPQRAQAAIDAVCSKCGPHWATAPRACGGVHQPINTPSISELQARADSNPAETKAYADRMIQRCKEEEELLSSNPQPLCKELEEMRLRGSSFAKLVVRNVHLEAADSYCRQVSRKTQNFCGISIPDSPGPAVPESTHQSSMEVDKKRSPANMASCISLVPNAHYGELAMTNNCAEEVTAAFCYMGSGSASFECSPERRDGWQRGSHAVSPGGKRILPDSKTEHKVIWYACEKGGIPIIVGYDQRIEKPIGQCK